MGPKDLFAAPAAPRDLFADLPESDATPAPVGTGTVLRTDAAPSSAGIGKARRPIPAPQPSVPAPEPDPARVQHFLDEFAKEGRQFRTQDELIAVARSLASNEIAQPAQGPKISGGQAFATGVVDAGQSIPGVNHVTAGLTNLVFGGDVSASDIGRIARDAKTDAREQHPNYTLAGDVVGFGAGLGRLALPVLNKAVAKISGSGARAQATRYGTRLAGLAGTGLAENAVYEATTGARNRAGDEGRAPAFSDRVEGAIKGGTDPFAAAGGPLASLAFRGGRKLIKGEFTPDAVIKAINGGSVGDVLDGVLDVPGAKRGDYRVVQRLLERSGVPRDRITAGLQRVRDIVESGVDSSLLPTRLKDVLVNEFQDFHGLSEAIETQVRGAATRSGSSSSATVQRAIDADNASAKTSLNSSLSENLGDTRRFDAEVASVAELQRIGREGYEPVLQAAQATQTGSAAAARLKETLLEEPLTRATLRRQAQLAGLSVDDYIDQRPFEAAHWVQSKLGAAGRGTTGREGIELLTARQNILDDLEEGAPGYSDVRRQYGDEFANKDALDFGSKFVRTARDERNMDALLDELNGFSDAQREAALLSIRDDLASRAGNVRTGQAPRLGEIVKEPVLQALRRVGPRGERVADDLLDIDARLQANARIDPRAGSPTANKQEAAQFARSNTRGPLSNALGSVFDRATTDTAISAIAGVPTPIGLARGIGNAAGRAFNGGANQQVDRVTELLMAQAGRGRPASSLPASPPGANSVAGQRLTGLGDAGAVGSNLPAQVPQANGFVPSGPVGAAVAGGAAGSLLPAENGQQRAENALLGAVGVGAGSAAIRSRGAFGRRSGNQATQDAQQTIQPQTVVSNLPAQVPQANVPSGPSRPPEHSLPPRPIRNRLQQLESDHLTIQEQIHKLNSKEEYLPQFQELNRKLNSIEDAFIVENGGSDAMYAHTPGAPLPHAKVNNRLQQLENDYAATQQQIFDLEGQINNRAQELNKELIRIEDAFDVENGGSDYMTIWKPGDVHPYTR